MSGHIMNVSELKGKKITVMGLGLHGGGIGTVRFLCEAGAQVTITDIKSKEELLPSIEKLKGYKDIRYIFNQHRPEDFSKADMIIKTPGAPWNNKYIQMAIKSGIPVEIDSGLFFKFCKSDIIGITGTKGKTTVSSLICEILKAGGKNVARVGIDQASVLDKLKDIEKDSTVVFELSSWRASALKKVKLSPHIAVMTNIYPDHMNYYKTVEAYVEDKKDVFLNQKKNDFCVLNIDDEILAKLELEIKSQLIKVSTKKIESGKGIYVDNGTIYLNDGVDEKKVLDISEVQLRGNHNIPNILLGIGAAWTAGVEIPAIRKAVLAFKGVTHRLEFIRELDGVKYFNDTAATTPEAAISGLNSFSEPVILICGGSDKNLDMSGLGKEIAKKAKGVIFFRGLGTEKIVHYIQENLAESESRENFEIVDSMSKAVELARKEADPGDIVLLSPGAASFGLFEDEFDRGNKFKAAVKALE